MKTTIEHCRFGKLTINGSLYTKDLLIYPDGRIVDQWWRKAGHSVCKDDIQGLIDESPQILIIGKGIPGLMKPSKDLIKQLEQIGIRSIAFSNKKAMFYFNEYSEAGKKVAACFHLFC